ncbi:MAG: hypothetical protein V2A58_11650 [Planctomycetota bacterium]
MKNKRCFLMLIPVLIVCASTFAAAPKIAWEENFDSPQSLARANFYVWPRHGGLPVDASVVIKEFSDGVFRFGLKYKEGRANDWLNLMFGDVVWGHKNWPEWGPFDLKEYPIVEIKWRGDPFTFYYGKETASGEKLQDYAHLKADRTETDPQGRSWNISIFRAAADSSVPGPYTPTKLLGINPMFTMADKDQVVEIDYIRVRGFTDEEVAREAGVIATLADFPKGRWRGLDTFFPWGVYGTGFLRGDFEWWAGDYEGVFHICSRNHINFIATNYEIELSRVGGRALTTDGWSSAVDSYAAAVAPIVESARASGLKLAGDVRYIMAGRDPVKGFKQILPIAQRVAREVHPDDDVVIAWTLADEPGVDALLAEACAIRALREADPLKRPELVVFNSPQKLALFVPYLSLNYWDNYPVLEGSRSPWNIRLLAREYRKLLPGVPMWPVLQAFETRPPAPAGSYVRPSDAEMRLMAYLSIAEGAKGIVWFHGYGSGRDEHLLERTGHARGGMLDTVAELGYRLIPIGEQLLATDPVDKADVRVTQLTEGASDHVLTVSVLKHRTAPVHYLLAINEDMDLTRTARAVIGSGILADGQGVYDLYALDGVNLLRGKTSFDIAPLAGGDARIYAVCTDEAFDDLRANILCARAVEDLRALMPDLAVARRWGVDLADVDSHVEASKASVQTRLPQEALDEARAARSLLFERIENDSELAASRRALRDIETELTEVLRVAEYYSTSPRWWTGGDHPMCIPNPTLLDQAKRYFEVGHSYRDCYAKYLKGDKAGLWTDLEKTRLACLKVREDILAFLRDKLTPAQEPPPASP